MTEVETFPAPELFLTSPTEDAWERERRAFHFLLPSLLATHRDLYVAIHCGRVVGEGPDQMKVALRAYECVGYVPVYVGLVSDRPVRPLRVPTPRLFPRGQGEPTR